MAMRPTKRPRLTPPHSEDEGSSAPVIEASQKAFFKSAASWNLEQDYENRPRKGKKDKESNRLPIKTLDGRIERPKAVEDDAQAQESDADWLGSGDEDEAVAETTKLQEAQIPPREQIRKAQEELAKIAAQLNENPEDHLGAFKALAKVGRSELPAVRRLAIVTQMVVYKDVIPGYRIRPVSEDASIEKVSKDVRKLRAYEQALVAGYQGYIKELTGLATSRSDRDLSTVAITCASTLVNAVPHFNFRGELLRILVRKLSSKKPDPTFSKCLEALETLFREDEDGEASMEAVSLLSKMMKARDYDIHETVLNLFLSLRLLSEFSGKASYDSVDPKTAVNGVTPKGKKQREKKEFRTKKERKALKEQKALQKDMDRADALVKHEERDRMQSDTLKMVFATYFRILKVRLPHLMGAVLEGLAKYAHLINQDFFGDLLEAMKDLIRYSDEDGEGDGGDDDDGETAAVVRNPTREALLCTVTAFQLLAGQDAHNARSNLHLDLSYFTTHLYRSLIALAVNPDLELTAKSLRLPDPDSPMLGTEANKINVQTTTVLLIRCLSAVLLPPWNIRSVPPLRLASFSKQLMTASLQVPEKSCQAILALLNDVSHTHGKKIKALWNTEERKGDGTYNPLSETVEGSNPFTATVWEGEILKHHYCPKVREGIKLLEKSLASS
jgi:nucleolar complex protein 3